VIAGEFGAGGAVVVAAVLLLVSALPGAALAAKPKAGASFAGTTGEPPIGGFHAPVSFKVSRDGKSLTGFTYSSLGCFGAGGFRAGEDVFTQPFSVIKVGTVKVAANGTATVTGARFVYTFKGTPNRTATAVSVSGRFSTPRKISGTISFTQSNPTATPTTCGPARVSFTARAR
jgi:hypothetical protein